MIHEHRNETTQKLAVARRVQFWKAECISECSKLFKTSPTPQMRAFERLQ
jgi:hypothetical protein